MRWEDERYIRIFTRDTPTWDAMGWEAQALLMLVFRKMDRTGLLELGTSGMRGLAACVRMPIDVVERSMKILLDDGVLSMVGPDVFCKNFMAAQECAKSDALRSKEKRERAHSRLTQIVSQVTQNVSQSPRGDTTAPQDDTPSVPSVPSEDPPIAPQGGAVNNLLSLTPPEPKRNRRSQSAATEGFLKFWEAYPRKTAKGQALKAWPGDELTDRILAALSWQVPTWREVQFMKHPATWLNARCWEDEKPQPIEVGGRY